jgi:hypothetical protein
MAELVIWRRLASVDALSSSLVKVVINGDCKRASSALKKSFVNHGAVREESKAGIAVAL